MKLITSLLLFSFSIITVFGQNFTGTVLDKETNLPLSLAQVYLVDLKTGTTTDENGFFGIKNYNQKLIHIQISFVGYKTLDKTVSFDTSKVSVFYLEQAHFKLQEVVISAPSGRLQGENIVSIESRKISELQQASPLTLAEAISNIPGVEQATTGVGIGKPVIRDNSMDSVSNDGDYQVLVRKQDTTEHCLPKVGEFTIGLYDCRKAFFSSMQTVWDKGSATSFFCQDDMNLRFNSWHHLAVSFSVLGFRSKIYRDGILQETEMGVYIPQFCNDISLSGVSDLVFGKDFTGKIDDVVIFDKSLSSQEVNEVMLMGSCCE